MTCSQRFPTLADRHRVLSSKPEVWSPMGTALAYDKGADEEYVATRRKVGLKSDDGGPTSPGYSPD